MNQVFAAAEWIGDRVNPIVVRELRQAVMSRFITIGLELLLVIMIAVLSIAMITTDLTNSHDQGIGLGLYTGQVYILYIVCMMIVPLYTGIRLANEISSNDLMFISTIKPRTIVYGKLWSAMLLSLVIFSATMPFMVLCYLLRGIDIPTILFTMTYLFLVLQLSTALWILWGALPLNWLARVGLLLLGAMPYFYFMGILSAVAGAYIAGEDVFVELFGYFFPSLTAVGANSWEFWAIIFSGVLIWALSIAMLMELAAAALAPPSANRMVPLRLFVTVVVFALLIPTAIMIVITKEPVWCIVWFITVFELLLFFLLLAVCERDEWGLRVRRQVPENILLRLLVFPFYTGALNGVVWCLGLLFSAFLATGIFAHLTQGWSTALTVDVNFSRVLTTSFAIALFAYDYCVTGALLQRFLFSKFLGRGLTWLVVALLLTAVCVMPVIVYSMFASHSYGYDWQDLIIFAPNPFMMFDGHSEFGVRPTQFVFAIVWSIVATIAALPWFIMQLLRFKPMGVFESSGPPPVGASPFEPGMPPAQNMPPTMGRNAAPGESPFGPAPPSGSPFDDHNNG